MIDAKEAQRQAARELAIMRELLGLGRYQNRRQMHAALAKLGLGPKATAADVRAAITRNERR